jgi:hypothetical protein
MRCLDKSSLSASLKKSKISHEIDNKSVLRFAFNDTHRVQIGFHFVVMHKNGELQVFYWGPYAGNHVPQVFFMGSIGRGPPHRLPRRFWPWSGARGLVRVVSW